MVSPDLVRLGEKIADGLSVFKEAVLRGDEEAETSAAGHIAAIVGAEIARVASVTYQPRLN